MKDFDFISKYEDAINNMLEEEVAIIESGDMIYVNKELLCSILLLINTTLLTSSFIKTSTEKS